MRKSPLYRLPNAPATWCSCLAIARLRSSLARSSQCFPQASASSLPWGRAASTSCASALGIEEVAITFHMELLRVREGLGEVSLEIHIDTCSMPRVQIKAAQSTMSKASGTGKQRKASGSHSTVLKTPKFKFQFSRQNIQQF